MLRLSDAENQKKTKENEGNPSENPQQIRNSGTTKKNKSETMMLGSQALAL